MWPASAPLSWALNGENRLVCPVSVGSADGLTPTHNVHPVDKELGVEFTDVGNIETDKVFSVCEISKLMSVLKEWRVMQEKVDWHTQWDHWKWTETNVSA